MLTRRYVLALAGVAALPEIGYPTRRAHADDPAVSFVSNIASDLVQIVNSSAPLAEKQKRLRAIVDSVVDVEEVARFCLGRFWRSASADQRKTYVNLFHEVLVNDLTAKLGEYQGVKVTVGTGRKRDDLAIVSSVVERPNNPPSRVEWVVGQSPGSLKVIDLIAEGTSLRLTQRSDYAAYVTRNNNSVEALLDAMKQHLAQAGG
jgi:phospholipid transport system substrate-binding protein